MHSGYLWSSQRSSLFCHFTALVQCLPQAGCRHQDGKRHYSAARWRPSPTATTAYSIWPWASLGYLSARPNHCEAAGTATWLALSLMHWPCRLFSKLRAFLHLQTPSNSITTKRVSAVPSSALTTCPRPTATNELEPLPLSTLDLAYRQPCFRAVGRYTLLWTSS